MLILGEVKTAMSAAMLAADRGFAIGIEVGTEKAWESTEAQRIARYFLSNQMDDENANFTKGGRMRDVR